MMWKGESMRRIESRRRVDIGFLKSSTVHLLLALPLLLIGASPKAESADPSKTMQITTAPRHVLSYPLLVSLETCNIDFEYGVAASVTDLSTTFGRKSPVQIQLTKKEKPEEYIVFGKEGGDVHDPTPRAPQEFLKENTCVSTTFDLYQNLRVRDHDMTITPGVWVLRACESGFLYARDEPFCSDEVEITIRAPTESEAEVSSLVRKTPSCRSWFPKVAVGDEANTVHTSDLPPETRRIVELISVLREAMDSGEQCLFAVGEAEANGVEWGPISSLIAGIQYECALDVGDDRVAQGSRAKIMSGHGSDFAITRIENGKGLISNLKRYSEQQSKSWKNTPER